MSKVRNSMEEFYEKHVPIAMKMIEELMMKQNYSPGLWICVFQNVMNKIFLYLKVPYSLYEKNLDVLKVHYKMQIDEYNIAEEELKGITDKFSKYMDEIIKGLQIDKEST